MTKKIFSRAVSASAVGILTLSLIGLLSCNTSVNPPPPSPNSLTAANSGRQVELTWTASEGADSYTVYWAETAAVDIEAAKAAGRSQEVPSGTSVTISTLTAGKTYYFAATASNVNGESAKSQEVSITLPPITVAASEIADRWGLFQVSGDAEENAAEDYYFGVKAADDPAPADSQAMQNDLNVKVYAVSSTPINIILSTVMGSPLIPFFNGATDPASAKAVWTDADLGFTNANVMPGDNQYAARDSLLSPSTAYKIYGYKQGESRVYELAKFTTIAVKTSFGGTGVWPTDSKRINDTITFHEGNYEILSLQRQGGITINFPNLWSPELMDISNIGNEYYFNADDLILNPSLFPKSHPEFYFYCGDAVDYGGNIKILSLRGLYVVLKDLGSSQVIEYRRSYMSIAVVFPFTINYQEANS